MFSMKIENIDITKTIESAKNQIASDKSLTPAIRSTFELLILVINLMASRFQINSTNSSKPPSQDPNRLRRRRIDKGIKRKKRKQGGQVGHTGSTLEKVENPNEIEEIFINKKTIPPGIYKHVGFESRQVFDIKISTHITEYRAEILEDKKGNQYVANFPEHVKKAVQYGNEVKSQSVYMSQFQLIPLTRVTDYFNDQVKLAISKGSISNFNQEAFEKLEYFEQWAKEQLLQSPFNHADETGINLNGKRIWLHNLSNDKVTLYHADEKRGTEAMDRMGILPHYKGILCHDHWKPYYKYLEITHVLCNAHHLRELVFAWEEDGQKWAQKMYSLLNEINEEVKKSKNGKLSEKRIKSYQKIYRTILAKGKKECPFAEKIEIKQGRTKKSKSRNLLERLIDFEEDTLMFMKVSIVSFTNNQGENDLRMTKVQQKISGCFRSMEGAQIFCRIRAYLVTCRKNGVSSTDALRLLFEGKLPNFIK
jgi:transposase